jgi:hypothetical protein
MGTRLNPPRHSRPPARELRVSGARATLAIREHKRRGRDTGLATLADGA